MAKIIINISDHTYSRIKLNPNELFEPEIKEIAHAIDVGTVIPWEARPDGVYTFENLVHLRDNIFDSINARFCEIAARIEE